MASHLRTISSANARNVAPPVLVALALAVGCQASDPSSDEQGTSSHGNTSTTGTSSDADTGRVPGDSTATAAGDASGELDDSAGGSTGDEPSESRCPPFPEFPDENCTGVLPGTVLNACDGNLETADAVYEGCLFEGGIVVHATGVTIRNSKIVGTINTTIPSTALTMVDVEIDGANTSLDATNSISGYTCTRCNVYNAAKGFTGSNFTVIDSYVHDIYGSGDSHNEAILGSVGNILVRHSRLYGIFNAASTGGGMSSAVSFYTHGDFWPPLDNVLFEQNYLRAEDGYCLYAGDDAGSSDEHAVSNAIYRDNVFHVSSTNPHRCGAHGPVTGFYPGNGNVWENNSYEDGTPIELSSVIDALAPMGCIAAAPSLSTRRL